MACENLSKLSESLDSNISKDYACDKSQHFTMSTFNLDDNKKRNLKTKKMEAISVSQNSLKNGLIASALDNQDSVYLTFQPLVNNHDQLDLNEWDNGMKAICDRDNKHGLFEKLKSQDITSKEDIYTKKDYLFDNNYCVEEGDFERKVQFEEIIVDGFSIRSFQSKSDLLVCVSKSGY